jgi:hypothetical protein
VIEPEDVATLAGGTLMVHCQAQGFPQPQITWMRGQGKRKTNKYVLCDICSSQCSTAQDSGLLGLYRDESGK